MDNRLKLICDKEIVDISCGNGVGSTFILVFDKNENLKLTVNCSWRLIYLGKILTSSLESNIEQIPDGLGEILNKKVLSLEINQFNDLKFYFENNIILDIFCDITDKIEDYFNENWYLTIEDTEEIIIATGSGELKVEEYK